MNTNTLNDYLLELVKESSKELLKIYFNKPNRRTFLRIPEYRSGEKRISEQELRFTLTNLHGQFPHPELYFSVETPSENNYAFDKNAVGMRSASTDLSFYQGEGKVMNIEFKAHIPSEQSSLDKDIEKLTKENINGAWVHLLKSENAGTIKTLFKKFEIAFNKFSTSKKPISFYILILESKKLLSRKGKENETNYSKNIFNINYDLWKELKKGQYQFKDWQVEVFDI